MFASLSGGERQRLFLVLALLNRPRLVILDELTQGLDPAARRNVWAAIRQLNDEGTTVLLVTHEMDEAEALCDRVAVTVRGHQRVIAFVCAALVRWEQVPPDLAIYQPGLEDALLGLLNGDNDERPAGTSAGELIGGRQ